MIVMKHIPVAAAAARHLYAVTCSAAFFP